MAHPDDSTLHDSPVPDSDGIGLSITDELLDEIPAIRPAEVRFLTFETLVDQLSQGRTADAFGDD
ncbi:MAG: hypothetical protein AAFQ13_11055 [Pseudomonadota bacterium]